MNKLRCLIYSAMLYLSVVFYFGYAASIELNETLSWALNTFIASSKLQKTTFKACETGQLEEYRIWKRRTLAH